jgi:hypothetical protein
MSFSGWFDQELPADLKEHVFGFLQVYFFDD